MDRTYGIDSGEKRGLTMKIIVYVLTLVFCGLDISRGDLSCSITEEQRDSALQEMEYDIGYGKQTML